MDDDVVEWACKAADAEYKLRRAVVEAGGAGTAARWRERLVVRGDERALQIFEATVSEILDETAEFVRNA